MTSPSERKPPHFVAVVILGVVFGILVVVGIALGDVGGFLQPLLPLAGLGAVGVLLLWYQDRKGPPPGWDNPEVRRSHDEASRRIRVWGWTVAAVAAVMAVVAALASDAPLTGLVPLVVLGLAWLVIRFLVTRL